MKRIVLIAVFVALHVVANAGVKKYVHPAGDNTTGLSWATAYTHPNRLNDSLDMGDTVYIAPNRNGTAVAPWDTVDWRPPRGGTVWTVYTDSGDGENDGRNLTILSAGLAYTGSWSVYSGSVYVTASTIAPRWNSWYANGYMAVSRNDSIMQCQSSLGAVDAAREYFYDQSTDLLYVYGNPAGHTIRYAQRQVVNFMYGDQDMMLFEDLQFNLGQDGVIALTTANMTQANGSDSIWIVGCNLKNTATYTAANNLGLVYSGSLGYPADTLVWGSWNRLVDDSLDWAWCPDGSLSGGAGLDWYSQRRALIQDCVFGPNLKAGGMMFKYGGAGSGGRPTGNIVLNCKILGGHTGIWFGNWLDDAIVAGTEIINPTYRGIDFHCTQATGAVYGDFALLFNTLFNCGGSDGHGVTISPKFEGLSRWEHNIVYDTISPRPPIAFAYNSDGPALPTPSIETYWFADYNMYYGGSTAFATAFTATSTCTGTNWAAWQSCGFDLNGTSTVDPGFASTSITAPDLSRPSSSQEADTTFLGIHWTRNGAWQPEDDPEPPILKRYRVRHRQ